MHITFAHVRKQQLTEHIVMDRYRYVVRGVVLQHSCLHSCIFIAAISILGLTLVTVAFFSVQPLEFCGIQQPLQQLTGSRYDISHVHSNIQSLNYPPFSFSCPLPLPPLSSPDISLSFCSPHRDKESDSKLVVTGVYRYVRHPMYTGLLIAIWSQPTLVSVYTCKLEHSARCITTWVFTACVCG